MESQSRSILLVLSVNLMLSTASCVNVGSSVKATFDSLEPGMSISQVSASIGSPDALVGEVTTAYGQRVVVWEYVKTTGRIVFPSDHDVYWVYLVDGRFLKYASKGDWQKEAGIIYRTDYSAFVKHQN